MDMIIVKQEALMNLIEGTSICTGVDVEDFAYSDINFQGEGFTEEAFDAEVLRVEAQFKANAYKENRKEEYPEIGDQLDALFHAGAFPAEMAAEIQAVKDKYPKE